MELEGPLGGALDGAIGCVGGRATSPKAWKKLHSRHCQPESAAIMFLLGHNGHLIGTGGRYAAAAALFTARRFGGGGIGGGRTLTMFTTAGGL